MTPAEISDPAAPVLSPAWALPDQGAPGVGVMTPWSESMPFAAAVDDEDPDEAYFLDDDEDEEDEEYEDDTEDDLDDDLDDDFEDDREQDDDEEEL